MRCNRRYIRCNRGNIRCNRRYRRNDNGTLGCNKTYDPMFQMMCWCIFLLQMRNCKYCWFVKVLYRSIVHLAESHMRRLSNCCTWFTTNDEDLVQKSHASILLKIDLIVCPGYYCYYYYYDHSGASGSALACGACKSCWIPCSVRFPCETGVPV